MEILINLFEELTSYFTRCPELLPIGVDLKTMTISAEASLAPDWEIEITEENVEINFRGYLGNPIITGYYNITMYECKVIKLVKCYN